MHAGTSPVPLFPSSDGVVCVPIPVGPGRDYSSLEVVWPGRRDTVGRLCYCPPFEGEQRLFSRCISTTSCDTDHSITVSNGSVCFVDLSPPLTSIPVYFTLLDSCTNGGCVIRSLVTSFIIIWGELGEQLLTNLYSCMGLHCLISIQILILWLQLLVHVMKSLLQELPPQRLLSILHMLKVQ